MNVSFILKDLAILGGRYDVDRMFIDTSGSFRLLLSLLKQALALPGHMRRAELVVVFFAGYHSVFPIAFARLMRKPVLLVLGGSDCYNFPSIDYGNYRKLWMRWATQYSIRHATHLSSVHEDLIESQYRYADTDYAVQGYKAFVPGVRTPDTVIYLEYEPGQFPYRAVPPVPKSFITVGFGMDGNTYKRKGVDLIVAVATALPDCTFTILGSNHPDQHQGLPANIRLLQPVPYDALPAVYQAHQFYLQLSMAEGFPSAICEAMLCGCIPIGSAVAAIPYIIGDTGFVLERKDTAALIALCRQALDADLDQRSKAARERIATICAPGTRAIPLLALAEELMSPQLVTL